METLPKLSLKQARTLHLKALGLLNFPTKIATKETVLDEIKKMSVLQIDTIHVINRSPYLVLWNRIGDFELEWITDLLAERKLFEYWSHEACFLPIEDYPFYNTLIHSKKARAFHWSKEWITANRKDANRVLDYVKTNGPTMSSTFTRINIALQKQAGLPPRSSKSQGWWNWKVEKLALDMLYTQGKLSIIGRKNFHRIYDLTERAIPKKYLQEKLTVLAVYKELITRTVRHLGIVKKSWVPDYFRIKKTVCYPIFEKLVKQNIFTKVHVKGFDELFYVHKDNMQMLQDTLADKLVPDYTTFLSPFDPLVWDRKRVNELFNFEYQIESYTPQAKRKYGYFTLPILHNGELIGRMDAKAHRTEGMFEVRALHFEDNFKPNEKCISDIKSALQKFAKWHKTPKIKITKVFPKVYKKLLK